MTDQKAAHPEPDSTVDYEVAALRTAYEALEHLDLDALRRILEWLEGRLIADAKKRQHEIEVRKHEAERRRLAQIEVPF